MYKCAFCVLFMCIFSLDYCIIMVPFVHIFTSSLQLQHAWCMPVQNICMLATVVKSIPIFYLITVTIQQCKNTTTTFDLNLWILYRLLVHIIHQLNHLWCIIMAQSTQQYIEISPTFPSCNIKAICAHSRCTVQLFYRL